MKPILSFLSEQEIMLVHETALRILNKIGMKMPHSEAHRILKKAGATVDEQTGIILFPEELVDNEMCIRDRDRGAYKLDVGTSPA